MLLSLVSKASAITKISLDSGPTSPTGQNTVVYTNGQQQAKLNIHDYGKDKQSSKKDIINTLKLYNNKNNKEIKKNSFYTLEEHNFSNGIIMLNYSTRKNHKVHGT